MPGVSVVRPAAVRLDDQSVGLDLHLITWYGHSVPTIAETVRAVVADRVAAQTGLSVAVVTVTVDDLLVPGVDSSGVGPPHRRTAEMRTRQPGRLVAAGHRPAPRWRRGGRPGVAAHPAPTDTARHQRLARRAERHPVARPRPSGPWPAGLSCWAWPSSSPSCAAGRRSACAPDERDGWYLHRRCVERRLADAASAVPGVRRARVRRPTARRPVAPPGPRDRRPGGPGGDRVRRAPGVAPPHRAPPRPDRRPAAAPATAGVTQRRTPTAVDRHRAAAGRGRRRRR